MSQTHASQLRVLCCVWGQRLFGFALKLCINYQFGGGAAAARGEEPATVCPRRRAQRNVRMGCSSSKDGPPEMSLSITQRNRLLQEFRGISSELEVEPMIAHTIAAILRVLPVDRASVFLVDRAAGVMRTFKKAYQERRSTNSKASLRASVATSKVLKIPITSGIAGAVVKSSQVVIVPDAQVDPRFNRRSIFEQAAARGTSSPSPSP